MAQTQENVNSKVAAFYACARSDSDCSPLSREELRQLIEQEFADAMENPQDPKTIKKVLCFLDDDSNCRVDFSDLLSLVFRVAKACYQPLQKHQVLEDGQEPRLQKEAGGEQPSGPHTTGRVSHNPEQGVNNEVQDTETQDRDTHQTQEGDTPEQDQDTRQTQEGDTPEQDQNTRQTQEGDTPEQDQDTRQTQEGDTPEQDQDTRQTQEGDTPEQDQDTRQTQEGDTPEQDQDTRQTQEGDTPEQDQDTHQDDRTEAPGGDPEGGEILDTATPEQDRNSHKAEETETPKQDPKTQQAQETEAPGQRSNNHQSSEMESAEKDLNCPPETRGRDPNNMTQVCKSPQQDPNPSSIQNVLPQQRGASPHWDPKSWRMCHDPSCHQLPESKVMEQKHSGTEALSCPAQQQQDARHQRQLPIEQQLLQSLYQWPPQQ
ncbi:CRNN protein, partial [Rhynochetos jubatus]|nr:CRNN protein [Rhynochetos jubatus]